MTMFIIDASRAHPGKRADRRDPSGNTHSHP
ncbi:hypothetical protein J2S22_003529 [Rhodoplanes tepidamans]|nr:hypothetical protein [Rhodoplanes tepidamans]